VAFLDDKELDDLIKESRDEAKVWRSDYPAYERLMNNDLMDGLDPNLPEVNDGSLAAALLKLPKRIVSSNLTGTVKTLDRDEPWLAELANLVWQKDIIPYANTQAPFWRKWKDAVRKAAGYGSVPIITLFVETNGRRHADFIVAQPQDVVIEAGKVSDYDADVMFWDVYFSELQVRNMIEQATEDQKREKKNDSDEYNTWDIPALKKIVASKAKEQKDQSQHHQEDNQIVQSGIKFTIAVQRGVNAPFKMLHPGTKATVREWSNPDPSGDTCIHFLYCYQDFVNPYGIGIVKLAGGTQNVLDYMRQADVLATQLGLRPPIEISGDAEEVDTDSLVYAQDAIWYTGTADVKRVSLDNGIYQQLPERIGMYKTSLNQLIPTGDTSIAAGSGDPNYSKTPAGVKFQQQSLSIDDEDFKDNLYMTYEAVTKSMINTHFANMEGSDFLKLSEDEREILIKAGIQFPTTPDGEMSNQVEIQWDNARATFDFEVDPEVDKTADDQTKLESLTKIAELSQADPNLDMELGQVGKKLNKGELYAEMIKLTTDNDKIITDVSPEEQQALAQPQSDPATAPQAPKLPSESLNYKDAPEDIKRQIEAQAGLTPSQMTSPGQQQLDQAAQAQVHGQTMDVANHIQSGQQAQQAQAPQPAKLPTPQEMDANVQAIMQQYHVDENTALTALAAEHEGLPLEDIMAKLQESAK
jgi:hypothetical protein